MWARFNPRRLRSFHEWIHFLHAVSRQIVASDSFDYPHRRNQQGNLFGHKQSGVQNLTSRKSRAYNMPIGFTAYQRHRCTVNMSGLEAAFVRYVSLFRSVFQNGSVTLL